MKFDLRFLTRSAARKAAVGGCAALLALSSVGGVTAHADPAQDNVANFNELSRQAQQMVENVQQAQLDLDQKERLQAEAEAKHVSDLAALQAANAQLSSYQRVVDTFAAAVYMGGRADGTTAFLTAPSPQSFIDRLTVQRLVSTKMTTDMQGFRQAQQQAQVMEATSAESAVAAKVATETAAARRADLKKKEAELQTQVATVKMKYGILTPAEQALLGPGAAIPTVGMSGLVPNAKMLAAYIIATYPGVQAIGGVRADPLPDHPSGHAIDIMIGSDMALGDAINADVQSKSGQFNVSYTMWRVPSHFNHVHVTVH